MRSFGESIYAIKTNIHKAEMDQANIIKFNHKSRPKAKECKGK